MRKMSKKEKEVKNFLNKEIKSVMDVNGFDFWFKWHNYYKCSFSVKYDCICEDAYLYLKSYVENSEYGNIIKIKKTINGAHGFEGILFSVKYKDLVD